MAVAAAAAAAEQPELVTDKGLFDFAASGWQDALAQLKREADALPKCTLRMHPNMRADDAIASAEAMDPKTDLLLQRFDPPTEFIKKGLMKRAADLTEAEAVAAADSLIAFYSMFARGTQSNISVDTCFYIHVSEYLEGSPMKAFMEVLAKSMVHIVHIVDASQVRDGDEEFSPGYFSTKLGAAVARDFDIPEATFAVMDAEAKKGTALAKRYAFLAAFARFTAVAMNLAKAGALQIQDELRVAAQALAATTADLAAARDASAPVPPDACFTGVGAVWDTISIPHVAVAPCAWSEATGFFAAVAEDTLMFLDTWLPTRKDLMATLAAAQRYCYRDPVPSLLARSVGASFVQASGMHPFGGETILSLMNEMLSTKYGAPWYAAATNPKSEEETKMQAEIVGALLKAMPEGRTEAEAKRFIVVNTTSPVIDVGRLILLLINFYLRNRGRCHRCLVNALHQLAQVQGQVWQADRMVFLGGSSATSFSKQHPQFVGRNEVLLALVSDMMHDTCFNILVLTQRLGLLTKPELLPVLAYYQHFLSARADNLASLHPNERSIAEFREAGAKRQAPAVLKMRVATSLAPLGLIRLEAPIIFCRAMTWVLNIIKAKVPALQMPEKSLQSLENIFNHRFFPLLATQQRPPLASFSEIADMSKVPDAAKMMSTAIEQFKLVRSRIAGVQEQLAAEAPETRRLFAALDKAAHKNAVSAGVVHRMEGFRAAIEVDDEFPFVLTLVAEKI